jgi:hypothetical protein
VREEEERRENKRRMKWNEKILHNNQIKHKWFNTIIKYIKSGNNY